MPKMTIIRGLPGAGKSTYAKKLGPIVIENDMMCFVDGAHEYAADHAKSRAIMAQTLTQAAMAFGVDVVVSNTFVRHWEMEAYLKMAKFHRYDVEVLTLTGNFGSIHNVPQAVLDRMKENWEPYDGEKFVK